MRSAQLPSFNFPASTKSPVTLPDPTPIAAAAGFSIGALIDDMKRIANAANAQHSTGPKTKEGKSRSSQNALRHGAFAQSTLLPTDDPKAFDRFRLDFLKTFSPQNTPELFLTERLISLGWRLQRLAEATAEFDNADDFLKNIEELDRLSRVEDRLQSMFNRAIKQLQQLQNHRKENPPEECPFAKEEFPQNEPTALVVQTPTPAQSDPIAACGAPTQLRANQPAPPELLSEKSAERTQPDKSNHMDAPASLIGYNPTSEAQCPIGLSKNR